MLSRLTLASTAGRPDVGKSSWMIEFPMTQRLKGAAADDADFGCLCFLLRLETGTVVGAASSATRAAPTTSVGSASGAKVGGTRVAVGVLTSIESLMWKICQ